MLCWHLLTKEKDYVWARSSLVAHKMRAMELQAGKPQKKGNSRGLASAYNVKELRNRERRVAEQAEKGYEHLSGLALAPAKGHGARAPQAGKARMRLPGGALSRCAAFATRSPALLKNTTAASKALVDRIRRVQLGAMLLREGHVGEDVRLGIIHNGCELRHLRPDLIGDRTPLNTGGLGRLLDECGGDEGGDDSSSALAGMRQHVPHEVHAAALPGRRQNLGDGSLQAHAGRGLH